MALLNLKSIHDFYQDMHYRNKRCLEGALLMFFGAVVVALICPISRNIPDCSSGKNCEVSLDNNTITPPPICTFLPSQIGIALIRIALGLAAGFAVLSVCKGVCLLGSLLFKEDFVSAVAVDATTALTARTRNNV